MTPNQIEQIEFGFSVAKAQENIECIQLLSKVMEAYRDMDYIEKDAITIWFYKNYNSRPYRQL